MSEHSDSTTASASVQPPNTSDTILAVERQAELLAAVDANLTNGRAPYAGVQIRTREELDWIMIRQDWSGARGTLRPAHLEESILARANLSGISLVGAHLEQADMSDVDLAGANLYRAHFEGTMLRSANLEGAMLSQAHMEGAMLSQARLVNAVLNQVHFEGANLKRADLAGADLRRAHFDDETNLDSISLANERGISARLADVNWRDVYIASIDWGQVRRTGDELVEGQQGRSEALRASSQLANLFYTKGLLSESTRFAYRSEVLQRKAHLREGRLVQWLFAWIAQILTGYGYKPFRLLWSYLLVFTVFSALFYTVGLMESPHLNVASALSLSLSSELRIGFLPAFLPSGLPLPLDHRLVLLADIEAFMGLFIEAGVIQLFIQRFMHK